MAGRHLIVVLAAVPALVAAATAPAPARPAPAGLATGGEQTADGPVAVIEAAPGDAAVSVPPRAFPPSAAAAGEGPAGSAGGTATATFQITYSSTVPTAARPAVQAAADIWSRLVSSAVPIRLSVAWSSQAGSTALASVSPRWHRNFPGAPVADTWYPTALADALAGANHSGNLDDITVTVSDRADWYLGTDGRPPAGTYDLVTVVLHELAHGLGMSGSMTVSGGRGSWGFGNPAAPTAYDRFAEDAAGARLLDPAAYPNNSAALGAALTGGALFFDSPATNRTAAGRPRLYAPATWATGSSFSHLDEDRYPAGSANVLMSPRLFQSEAAHTPGPLGLCILEAMGWATPQDCTPPAVTTVTGATWYSDGAGAKAGPAGTPVSAYGTGLRAGTDHQLVTGLDGGVEAPCMWDVAPVTDSLRRSSPTGLVGHTRGTVGRGAGAWQVCLRQAGEAATPAVGSPRSFTVG